MTLKNRNRIFFVSFVITATLAGLYAAVVVFAAVRGEITPPDTPVRILTLPFDGPLFRYEFTASLAASGAFILYVPLMCLVLGKGFGNTQSLELIYFAGFLLSCVAEGVRILVPLFDLWKSYSLLLVCTGRVIIAGRLLSLLSFLFAALFNATDQRQNVEQNLIIMVITAAITGMFFPLNTTQTSSACTVIWGYRPLFFTLRAVIFALTIITFCMNAHSRGNRTLILTTVAYAVLVAGYSLLGMADCYFFLLLGTVLFVTGTSLYLSSIHSVYMWK